MKKSIPVRELIETYPYIELKPSEQETVLKRKLVETVLEEIGFTDKEKEVFFMKEGQAFSFSEIALFMKSNKNSVYTIYKKAEKKFKKNKKFIVKLFNFER